MHGDSTVPSSETAAGGPHVLVEVRWLVLDQPEDVVAGLEDLLDADELFRIVRLKDPIGRRRATVRLGRRRELLTALAPYAATGDGDALRWSSSHRDGYGLLAVTSGRRLGVDVESRAEVPDALGLVAAMATEDERHRIEQMAATERLDAALGMWTRKEAYLKATRRGIGAGMRHVEVPEDLDPHGVSFRPEPDGGAWLLYELACPAAGHRAALVVEQLDPSDRCEVRVATI